MLVIWGLRRHVQVLAMFTFLCPACSHPAAHPLRRVTAKFTLFLVPLFTVSRSHHVQCTYCGSTRPVGSDEAANLMASGNHAPAHGRFDPEAGEWGGVLPDPAPGYGMPVRRRNPRGPAH